MLDSEQHPLYPSNVPSAIGGRDYQDQGRLALYQVFLRVYEQNRDLLNAILELEGSGKHHLSPPTTAYVQGLVVGLSAYLVTNLIESRTQVVTAHEVQWTIGRDRRITELSVADRRLSRRHATIAYDIHQHQFQILDLGSTNGTFVNGEQIVQQRYLNDGDRIRLGSLEFNFFMCHLLHPNKEFPGNALVSSHQQHHPIQNGANNEAIQHDLELDKQTLTGGPMAEDIIAGSHLYSPRLSGTSEA